VRWVIPEVLYQIDCEWNGEVRVVRFEGISLGKSQGATLQRCSRSKNGLGLSRAAGDGSCTSGRCQKQADAQLGSEIAVDSGGYGG